MEERIDLLGESQRSRAGGVSIAVVVSIILHTSLAVFFLRHYQSVPPAAENVPIARYVDLIRGNAQEFVEAPGQKRDSAPLNAPFSDANRRASTPRPTGDVPTNRPGDGRGLYTPPSGGAPRGAAPTSPAAPPAEEQQSESESEATPRTDSASLAYHPPATKASTGVDLRSAIREIGKIASLGGGGGPGLDMNDAGGGGEKGYADSGPLSFESQWYDWGEYAASMVSRIRVNWYNNMPPLIRTGMQGVVTIRFTIQRDGRITDVVILASSNIPPYDHAARKAIELSSPLNPLPADFPNASERVTAMFYYNKRVPTR